jgi:hypothetical protein
MKVEKQAKTASPRKPARPKTVARPKNAAKPGTVRKPKNAAAAKPPKRETPTPVGKLVPHLRMVLTKIDEKDARVVDRLGGSPNRWADPEPWPKCKSCGDPMHFVLQLAGEMGGGRAQIGPATSLQLFVCQSEDDCEYYALGGGSNHVALRKKPLLLELQARPAGRPSAAAVDKLRVGKSIAYEEGADDPEALEDYAHEKRQSAAFSRGFKDKLYGVPVAANDPDEVACDACAKPLAFLGQILSADDWFIYYLQSCPNGHQVSFHAHRA